MAVREQLLAETLAKARSLVLARAPNDYAWFIKHFISIEIKDVPGAIGNFVLWPFQVTALHTMLATQRLLVLKARQLGLSWLVLAYAACRMLFKPGYRVAAISKTDKESMEMARRLKVILENLPEWVIREHKKDNKNWGGPTYEANTDRVLIHFPMKDGRRVADSIFTALPQSADSGRSLTGDLLILDEYAAQDYAEEIWAAAGPTINDGSGQAIVISTGKRNTKFEELCNLARKGEGRFKLLFFPWNARPDRTEEWYENTKADFPNSYKSEYPRNEDEAFSVGAGRFFSEWDEDVHIIQYWHPPKWWRRWGAYDPGFSSNASFVWYAIEPKGRCAVAYREYYPKRVTDEEQARKIVELSVYEDGEPEVVELVATDREAWNRPSETEESTADIFLGHGINLVPAAKSRAALRNGWRRLHAALRPRDGERPGYGEGAPPAQNGKWSILAFSDACSHTRRTMPSCEEAKNDPEDISKQSEHHCADCHRMFIMHYPLEIPGAPASAWDKPWNPENVPTEDQSKLPFALRDDVEQQDPWA